MENTNAETESETKLFQAHVDRELVESADFAWGEKTTWLERMLKRRAYGEEFVEAEVRNELTAEHLDLIDSARDELCARVTQRSRNGMITVEEAMAIKSETLNPVIHALARDQYERDTEATNSVEEERAEAFERKLETIESNMRDGVRVFPSHGKVEKAAAVLGKDPEEVIARLRARNPDVPPEAFKPGTATHQEWWGLPAEEVDTPVEERKRHPQRESAGSQSAATDGGEVR